MMSLPPGHDHEASLPELLTRPLADNAELRLFIQADLEQRMADNVPGPGEDTAEQAALRLAAPLETSWRSRHWLAIATIALTVLWGIALAMEIPGFLLTIVRWEGSPGSFADRKTAAYANSLIVPGAPFDFTWEANSYWSVSADRAWRQNPGDSAIYYLYCRSQLMTRTGDGLPSDYTQVWRSLDPDNAIWPLMKASRDTWRAIDPKSRDSKKGLVVVNPALFAEGIASFEEAARLPRLVSFNGKLQPAFRNSLVKPATVAEADALRYLQSSTFPVQSPRLESLMPEAERRASLGDKASLATFLQACRTIQLRTLDPDSRVFHGIPGRPAKDMARLAGAAGLVEEQRRFMELYELLRLPPAPGPQVSVLPAETGFYRLQALSGMGRAGLAVSLRRQLLLVAGLLSAMAWLLWIRRVPFGGAADRYSGCLYQLFPWREMLRRVILPAVLPPLFLLAMLLPFLSASETDRLYSNSEAMILSGFSLGAVLILLVLLYHRELARRTGFLGMAAPPGRAISLRFPVLLILFAQVALFAGFHPILHERWIGPWLVMLVAAIAVGLFSGVVTGYSRGLTSRAHAVRHRLLARLLARLLQPSFIILGAAVLLTVPVLHLVERRLVSSSYPVEEGDPRSEQNPRFASGVRKLYQDWGIPESAGKTHDGP